MTKKRLVKKAVAFVAAAMMLVGMVIPAIAAPGDTGSITVHKYTGDSLENAVENTTGQVTTVHSDFDPLEDAEFELWQLKKTGANSLKTVNDLVIQGYVIQSSVARQTGVADITLKKGTDVQVVTVANTGSAVKTGTTDSAGLIAWTGLDADQAYYVLIETDTPDGHHTTSPSLIRLPIPANGDGDAANFNVHVYPKNKTNTDVARKVVTDMEKPVAKGQDVDFILKGDFSSDKVSTAANLKARDTVNDVDVYGEAAITDTFSSYFTYKANSVKVYFINAAGDLGAQITNTSLFNVADTTGTDGKLTVSLTNAGINAAIDDGAEGLAIRVTATYTGNAKAVSGKPAALTNAVSMYVKAAMGDEGSTAPGGTEIPKAELHVTAKDKDGNPIKDAEFILSTSPDPADVVYAEDGTTPLKAKTDEDGNVTFVVGDYDPEDGNTYYLINTEVPAGLDLADTMEVEFKSADDYKNDPATSNWFDDDGNFKESIKEYVNVTIFGIGENARFSLPLTGGAGTVAFTVAGVLVMLGAAVLIVRKKKTV